MELNSNLSTTNSTTADPEGRSVVVTICFLLFYTIVVSMALIGNLLVMLTIYKNAHMRTVVNIFLANLACSDFLFAAISIFDPIAYMLSGWYAGEGTCKIQSYLIEVFYTCSILTLVAVSCERYLAICRPHLKSRTKKQTFIVIAIAWLTSVGFCSVLIYAYRIRYNSKGVPVCENLQWSAKDRRVFYTIHSVVVYLVPLSIMIWAHHKISGVIATHRVPSSMPINQEVSDSEINRNGCESNASGCESSTISSEGKQGEKSTLQAHKPSKLRRVFSRRTTASKYRHMRGRKKVIKILITVTVTFFTLWTPFIITRMLLYYGLSVHVYIWRGTQLLILSSTAVNGLIYALMSPQFRRCFKTLIPCFRRHGKGDSEATPSRGREMNSCSNSQWAPTSAPSENLKTRSLTRSFHVTKN